MPDAARIDLLNTLQARGLVQDATPGLAERLTRGPITGYCGFDPTADSLHVGNLVPVMGLAWLQRAGGRPLVVVGGGTGLVGDPSGKRSERPMLTQAQVVANTAAIRAQLERFLDFEGARGARMLDNADWLRSLPLLDFLRDTGKHFTINYMLQKESVRSRMETGISFTEFSYMLVQAFDFDHLFETEGCQLQLGGSDQWGNITAGIELIARRRHGEAHGLTLPLLTTSAGAKFGKSEDGNVWLDPTQTSPYKFFQFWINKDDQDVGRLLRIFTFLDLSRIDAVLAEHTADPSARTAQRLLAREVTTQVHGADVTDGVEAASRILFGGTDLRTADARSLAIVEAELPLTRMARSSLGTTSLVEALVQTGLAPSKGEARRGLQGSGFSVNGEKASADRPLTDEDLLAGKWIMLQRGRRSYAMVIVD
ncbi:MAG: tyrosine--tRNA ligase [Gemmatimonadota bacterium]